VPTHGKKKLFFFTSKASLKFPSSELPEIWGIVTGFPRGQYYTGWRLSSTPLKLTILRVFKNCF
jgi:hypothetical protein